MYSKMMSKSEEWRLQSMAAISGMAIGIGAMLSGCNHVLGAIFGVILMFGGVIQTWILCATACRK